MALRDVDTGGIIMSVATGIRPFTIETTDQELQSLRRRVAETRWPDQELVNDRSQGVQSATLHKLAEYWVSDYDWRACESKLNELPQFKTEIDGVDIHFIHVRSKHEDALPLIMTHGWPGSVIEMLDVVGPITDPTAHGGRAEDAFHLVLPSLPGYGFSGHPTQVGWNANRIAQAWAALMHRLGYTRYVAQGGDQGASVTDAMARQAPDGLIGIHLNLLASFPLEVGAAIFGPEIAHGLFKRVGVAIVSSRAEKERVALDKVSGIFMSGYIAEMNTKPQTIGAGLTDTPVGLAAWILDHDADSYEKISHAFLDGKPSGGLTPQHVLDNITLYWLTNTATSSARLYWENAQSITEALNSGQKPPELSLPVAYTVFPDEIFQAPKHWAEKVYPNLIYFNEVDKGGHFAAWEEPELFADELRNAFRSLR
jgi:pimeloyl-ACP methyl ester carboxylesterase